jgi:hypothetical protein
MEKSIRMMIHFTAQEADALSRSATRARRDPREQAAMFIRQGLGLDGQFVRLSPVAVSALERTAEERGLGSIDEALEHLIWKCAGAVAHPAPQEDRQ